MSKPRQIKRRKRKTGYLRFTKGSGFKYTFYSFEEFARVVSQRDRCG